MISTILGVIGIFLPVLPTTPFLLLASFLFERSSPKFHNMIINNPIFGKYISDYQEKKGITLKNKIISITVLTLGMGKGFFSMQSVIGRSFLIVIFLSVFYHIVKIKTLKGDLQNV